MTDQIRAALVMLRNQVEQEIERLAKENRRLLIVDRERCIQFGEMGEDEPCPVLAAELKAHEQTCKERAELSRYCLNSMDEYTKRRISVEWLDKLETWAKEE